jgi:hypothetical protein
VGALLHLSSGAITFVKYSAFRYFVEVDKKDKECFQQITLVSLSMKIVFSIGYDGNFYQLQNARL